MAQTINVGLRIPSIHPTDPQALRRFVQEAEILGFHSIWVGDHVFFHQDILHPLSALAWTAALTSRVQLGMAVMPAAYLDPVVLAKEAGTVDCLSNGRLVLGISLGGTEAEYTSLGVPMDQRAGRLRESITVMRLLWTQDDVAYEGRYRRIEHGRVFPRPVHGTVPIWLGGHSEGSLRRTAAIADGWIAGAGSSPERASTDMERVWGLLHEQGRDVVSFGFGKLQSVSVDRDRERALRRAEEHLGAYYGARPGVPSRSAAERGAITGTPEECAERLQAYCRAAVPELTLILEPSGLDIGQLELLAETAVMLAPA